MIDHVVVLGAGRSSSWLVSRLAGDERFRVTLIDPNPPAYLAQLPQDLVTYLDEPIESELRVAQLAKGALAVISLLPPPMHPMAARAALEARAHFLSASYETDEIRALGPLFAQAGLTLLSEAGLDPGIDHFTALSVISRIRGAGGEIVSFESYCGGLPAQASVNPAGYQFFWAPSNVVQAGSAGARYRDQGQICMDPYHRVFMHPVLLDGLGQGPDHELSAYPNRDSIPYEASYGLEGIESFIRGTIRYRPFCALWQQMIDSGWTNDHIPYTADQIMGSPTLLNALEALTGKPVRVLESAIVSLSFTAPLRTHLLTLLQDFWKPGALDGDRVVMVHRIRARHEGGLERVYEDWMDIKGSEEGSAMALTVGTPLFIAVEALSEGVVFPKGTTTPANRVLALYFASKLGGLGLGMTHYIDGRPESP